MTTPEQEPSDPENGQAMKAVHRKGSFGQTLKAVSWSFFGVRKSSDYARDVSQINPLHVLIAGVLLALAFVLGLVFLVQWVVQSGVAH